ncbi:Sideroflexin FSF1 [Saitoella coloradoensis]
MSIQQERSLPSSRYDLDTYLGRVRHMMEITDPRTLFTSGAQLAHAKKLIADYKAGKISWEMTEELWEAKKIVESTLHPDTQEPVFLPFRMSSFVLTNLVVTAGMLTPNLGTTGTLFWQWVNQSVNVAINASNANKSSPLSWSEVGKSYAVAVSASCGVAVGLNSIVPKLRVSPSVRGVLGRLVPFAAVASAGALNVFLMRGSELRNGIDVYAPNDPTTSLGKSQSAALTAVGETAISRVLNASPIMVIPPLILMRLQRPGGFLARNPRMTIPTNIGLIFATSLVALPLAVGVFPQRQRVSVGSVEERFRELKDKEGTPITQVEFNRGI